DVCSSDLAEGVPLSDTCQTPHTPSGGANELQLSGASPVPVRRRCAFVGHMSITSHPLWRCQRAPAERGKPSEQSAEGVPCPEPCYAQMGSACGCSICWLFLTHVHPLTPPLGVPTRSSGAGQAQGTVR